MHSKCNLICILSFCAEQHHFSFFFLIELMLAGWLVCLLTEELSLQISQKPKQQKPANTTLNVYVNYMRCTGIVCMHSCKPTHTLLAHSHTLVIVFRVHTFFASLRFVYGRYGCNVLSLFSILICCWNFNKTQLNSNAMLAYKSFFSSNSICLFKIVHTLELWTVFVSTRDVTWKMVAIWIR